MKKTNKGRVKGRSPFTLRERSIIEIRWCRDNKTITYIAEELGRHKSSVSREIGGKPRKGFGKYDADRAQAKALERIGKRGNIPKTERHEPLKAYIEDNLRIGWSPEQISIRLPIEYQSDASMRIATESVYQEVYRRVYRAGNGAVKKGMLDLRPYLARRHTRRAKKGFRKARKEERLASLPSIDMRPKEAEEKQVVGHWEGDTLVSRESVSRVKSLNERVGGVVFFGKTKDGTANACNQVALDRLGAIPSPYLKTLTQDRGSENREYETLEKGLGVTCFFAHAYCSYERGANENANGLLRRYFPKKTDWARVSDEEIARAEQLINTRPRKRLGGFSPVEVFYQKTGVALYSGIASSISNCTTSVNLEGYGTQTVKRGGA